MAQWEGCRLRHLEKGGRVPMSFPRNPRLLCSRGISFYDAHADHVSHTRQCSFLLKATLLSFLPFSEPSLSAPPSHSSNVTDPQHLDPTPSPSPSCRPIRSLTWILEQGRGRHPHPGPSLIHFPLAQPPSGQTRKPRCLPQPCHTAPPRSCHPPRVVVFIGKRHSDPSAAPSPLWCSPGRGPHRLDVRQMNDIALSVIAQNLYTCVHDYAPSPPTLPPLCQPLPHPVPCFSHFTAYNHTSACHPSTPPQHPLPSTSPPST